MGCAYNVVSGDCYGIERREGRFGSGNFDDGFIAAQEEADQQTSGLYAVIGVLGGVVGIMLIVIVFGGYYLYNKTNKGQVAQIADESGHKHHFTEDDDAHLMENTQETRWFVAHSVDCLFLDSRFSFIRLLFFFILSFYFYFS